MKTKLTIGEFSSLCGVTAKTLRHYEKLQLLMPDCVDEWSGYRYYTLAHAQRLNRILHLKRIGLSLEEISELFESGDDRPDSALIKQKIVDSQVEIRRLKTRVAELRALKKMILAQGKMKQFEIKDIPARIVASYRCILNDYSELGPLCYNVIGPEMMRIGCTCPEPQYCYAFEHSGCHVDSKHDVEYCEAVGEMHDDTPILHFYESPAIRALCYYHKGYYHFLSESMTALIDYAHQHNLQIVDEPRFSYIDGVWNKDNPEDYLTEIQLPIQFL